MTFDPELNPYINQVLLRISATIPRLAVGVLTLVGFWLASKVACRLLSRALSTRIGRVQADSDLADFLRSLVRYTIMAAGVVSALGTMDWMCGPWWRA